MIHIVDEILVTDAKIEIPALVWLLKSNILSSTSFHLDNTFRGVVNAAKKQLGWKANMVAHGLRGARNLAPGLTPESLWHKNVLNIFFVKTQKTLDRKPADLILGM